MSVSCKHPSFNVRYSGGRRTYEQEDGKEVPVGWGMALEVHCAVCGRPFAVTSKYEPETPDGSSWLVLDPIPGQEISEHTFCEGSA